MDTRYDISLLAFELARERTEMKREPVDLQASGEVWRSLSTSMRNWVSLMERAFEMPLEQATFCSYHPAECSDFS
jgi:hypothetical protein